MKIIKIILLSQFLIGLPLVHANSLNGYVEIPKTWKTEVIPFPLSFAPEIKLTGVEELVFAPGMYKAEKEDFFSYAFMWEVDKSNADIDTIKKYLSAYYKGLYKAVANKKHGEAKVNIQSIDSPWRYQGTISWIEPFTTKQPQILNFKAKKNSCENQSKERWFFVVSPQLEKHAIWDKLESLSTSRC